jgi:hypothetical protein
MGLGREHVGEHRQSSWQRATASSVLSANRDGCPQRADAHSGEVSAYAPPEAGVSGADNAPRRRRKRHTRRSAGPAQHDIRSSEPKRSDISKATAEELAARFLEGLPPNGIADHRANRTQRGPRVPRWDDLERLHRASAKLAGAPPSLPPVSWADRLDRRMPRWLYRWWRRELRRLRRDVSDAFVRWVGHGIFLAVAAALASNAFRVLLLVLFLTVAAVATLWILISILSSAIAIGGAWAFALIRSRLGGRPPRGSREWTDSRAARLLNLIAAAYPDEFRSQYVEEQCANLAATGSQFEWFRYVSGQLIGLPWIAWAFYAERRRRRA